jgi:hypothetical protein
MTNVAYRLCPCEPERVETPEWIAFMFASDYVRAADTFEPRSLDSRSWTGCIAARARSPVLPKLRPGALLIVDNVNWFLPSTSRAPSSRGVTDSPLSPTWERFANAVSGWEMQWTENGVADTAIWTAP